MQLHGQGLSAANPPSMMVRVFVMLLLLLGHLTVAFIVEFEFESLADSSTLPDEEEGKSCVLD